jgi:hypothetical protein
MLKQFAIQISRGNNDQEGKMVARTKAGEASTLKCQNSTSSSSLPATSGDHWIRRTFTAASNGSV